MSTLGEGTQSQILVSTGGVLYDQVPIAALGQTTEFVLPTDFHTCLIKISVQGPEDTNPATYDELLANVTAYEIFTTEGEALRVEGGAGADPFYYSWWTQKDMRGSYMVGGALATEVAVVTYKIPLSLGVWRWYNHAGEFFGLPLEIADRLRVVFSTDAASGLATRTATIQAFGLRKPRPKAFRTTIPDAYAAAIGQSHWTELPADTRLAGVWTFHTTAWNSDTVNTELTVEEQSLAYGRPSFFKRCMLQQMQDPIIGNALAADPDKGMITTDCYTYWPLDPCEMGAGEPNPGNLVVESIGGQAEACRVYPVVWRLV